MTAPDDRFRPQWHFTPAKNWINDPNGLVWFDGEYHLFFQYNPFGDQWGHMSWGHAVSTDLLHWQELPVAIPEDERVSIFSGSVVVDATNRSGLGTGREPVLLAFYTGCRRVPEGGQAQELAWSTDRGRTWHKHPANPVLDIGLKDFRDPKVFWHEATRRWVMAVVRPDDHQVSFYASTTLTVWQHLSDFGPLGEAGGIWECPDLIEFPQPGGGASRWVLKVDTFAGHPGGTGAQVFIGRFDGTTFHPETHTGATASQGLWVDHGSDFYAALSWAHLPAGARAHGPNPVWIGWMNNHAYAKHTPTAPWRGAMSVPRELFLVDTAAGPRLGQAPLAGLQALRGAPLHQRATTYPEGRTPLELGHGPLALDGRSLELCWQIDTGADPAATAPEFGLLLRCGTGPDGTEQAVHLGVDRQRGTLWLDRSRSGFQPDAARWAGRREAPLAWPAPGQPLTLRVLLDRCAIEVFSGDGLSVLTELVFPADDGRGLQVWARGGAVRSAGLTVWPLASTRPQEA